MEDVERVWGFHADPTNAVGTIGIREGYVAAAVDRFMITVKGTGCHGAHPDDGIDPIVTSAAIIQALQSIVSRNVNAFHPSLLSVTRISAGTTYNVIPAEAVMEGTVRTMEKAHRALYEKRMREMAKQTAKAYGAEAEITWIAGSPAVYNHQSMADIVEKKAKESGFLTVEEESSMGGDDFSFYEEKKPGCYIKVGTGKGQLIHQPGFMVDKKVILSTAEYLAELLFCQT